MEERWEEAMEGAVSWETAAVIQGREGGDPGCRTHFAYRKGAGEAQVLSHGPGVMKNPLVRKNLTYKGRGVGCVCVDSQ